MSGEGSAACETMKVSTLKRPTKLPTPVPVASVRMSPTYQASPNGAFGTWMEKRSKSVFAGRSWTTTSKFSNSPKVWSVTFPEGVKGQVLAGPFDFVRWNVKVLGGFALAWMGASAADAINKARI